MAEPEFLLYKGSVIEKMFLKTFEVKFSLSWLYCLGRGNALTPLTTSSQNCMAKL